MADSEVVDDQETTAQRRLLALLRAYERRYPDMRPVAGRILVVGATGFIGRHIVRTLLQKGCALAVHGRRAGSLVRLFPQARHHALDLATVTRPDDWRSMLEGVDRVVMAAGIMGEHGTDTYARIHGEAACALFEACADAGVRRIILISASGADQATSSYWRTKAQAERCLERLGDEGRIADWAIFRPSVVVGRGGASDALFRGLAVLPLVPRIPMDPGRLRPIHVLDLAAMIAEVLLRPVPIRCTFDVGGPEPHTLAGVLDCYRAALGLAPAPHLPISFDLLAGLGRLAHWLGAPPPLDAEPVRLLALAPAIDPEPVQQLSGITPRPLAEALADEAAARGDLAEARTVFLGLAARVVLAILWLGSGLVSLLPFARPDGLALLAEIGVTGWPAPILLYAAAAADIAVGVALLRNWRPVLVGVIQLCLVLVFTAILTTLAPVWWLHPFGPLLKNLPVLVLVLFVMAREGR